MSWDYEKEDAEDLEQKKITEKSLATNRQLLILGNVLLWLIVLLLGIYALVKHLG